MDQPAPTPGFELTAAAVVANTNLGQGRLTIDDNILKWVSDDAAKEISLQYPNIFLHAISRDPENVAEQCLFMMVGSNSNPDLQSYIGSRVSNNGDHRDDDEEEEEDESIEVRFIPNDKSLLDTMYKVMTDCQRLHPDPSGLSAEGESDFDGEDEDEELYDHQAEGDEIANGSNGQAADSNGDHEPMDQ